MPIADQRKTNVGFMRLNICNSQENFNHYFNTKNKSSEKTLEKKNISE